MLDISFNRNSYSYTLKINMEYAVAACNVEEAKERLLQMIEEGIDNSINEKLSQSSAIVEVQDV